MLFSIMKSKSIDDNDNNNWFFFKIKHAVCGSKSAPFETLVPAKVGLINDLTNNGISFF